MAAWGNKRKNGDRTAPRGESPLDELATSLRQSPFYTVPVAVEDPVVRVLNPNTAAGRLPDAGASTPRRSVNSRPSG